VADDLQKLNIGCGASPRDGWVNLDIMPGPGVDLVFDLETCSSKKLPYPDNSFGEFRAFHILEHIQNLLELMEELHRVAADGAILRAAMPHIGSDTAWADPTHRRGMSATTFTYFAQPTYTFADYGYRGDWDLQKIYYKIGRKRAGADVDNLDRLLERVEIERNIVREMFVELRAVKPARPRGSGGAPDCEVTFVFED